ncbi:MAG: DUF3144 domain-containing protein [Hyphomicrobiaceae bacterium TMED74]|nr:hypothetical protein [Filomicrobium sp.]RPG39717.1 MAG: DUF3144 domain-containing protein [Hyphomicrobiaceae bacterium TMED74]
MSLDDQNRKARRAARTQGQLDTAAFLKVADRFIDVANRENQKIQATELHMAFLFATARCNAHVAKNIMQVDKHEDFVNQMVEKYREMLRQHLADGGLDPDG